MVHLLYENVQDHILKRQKHVVLMNTYHLSYFLYPVRTWIALQSEQFACLDDGGSDSYDFFLLLMIFHVLLIYYELLFLVLVFSISLVHVPVLNQDFDEASASKWEQLHC